MTLRRAVTLGLIVATALLASLAYASPPDPVWVTGFFDDDDADNVVEFIASATGLVASLTFHRSPPVPVVASYAPSPSEILPTPPPASTGPVRGPPSS